VHASLAESSHTLELAAGLIAVRRLVRATAADALLSPTRAAEVVLAVHEVAMNALTHGLGEGSVRIRAASGELVCEVEDHGPGISDALAGSKRPDADRTRGRGLWIARQLCEQLEIESAPGRSVVRLSWQLR
jgi:anti-sigma regulatory factor (Ser/Thr protein kinase)